MAYVGLEELNWGSNGGDGPLDPKYFKFKVST